MLVEFSVENYKSIKERQTLSMVAGNGCIETGFKGAPNLNEIAAIYGPNGSGKSNLIEAMDFFREFVFNSHKLQPDEKIQDVVPFLFSKKTKEQPSTFEVAFVHDDFLFQYGFSLDSKKIYEEWLYATPKGRSKEKTQNWLKRDLASIKSPAKKIPASFSKDFDIKKCENQLFLSIAANRRLDDFEIAFAWFNHNIRIIDNPENLSPNFTIKQIMENGKKPQIMKMMKGLDLSFDDVQIVEKEFVESDLPKDMPESIKQEVIKSLTGKKGFELFGLHKVDGGDFYPLPFRDESEGTQKLFEFSAPILDVLENGYTLVVDEIEKSLHPIALKGIISLFRNVVTNPKNAQLIFTTHNTSVMNNLDREQIWLLDKGKFGETVFTALSEFKDKPDAPLEKRYLGGRYGALPNIGDIL